MRGKTGPDGQDYRFGWLGEEHRVGRAIIVESYAKRTDETPEGFVVYMTDPATREVHREILSWATLNEALLAVVMLTEGVNVNTIAHTVPMLIGGIKAAAKEE